MSRHTTPYEELRGYGKLPKWAVITIPIAGLLMLPVAIVLMIVLIPVWGTASFIVGFALAGIAIFATEVPSYVAHSRNMTWLPFGAQPLTAMRLIHTMEMVDGAPREDAICQVSIDHNSFYTVADNKGAGIKLGDLVTGQYLVRGMMVRNLTKVDAPA